MEYEKHRDYNEYFAQSVDRVNEHFHKSIEIIYSEAKSRPFTINGKEMVLKTKEILVIPPLLSHSYSEAEGGVCHCNVFPAEYSDEWEKFLKNKEPVDYIIRDEKTVEDISRHLSQISPTTNKLLRSGIYNYTLGKIMECMKFKDSEKTKELDFTAKVLEYIDAHFSEDITLSDMSKEFGYSKYYFSNLFNKCFKDNLKSYLNEVRISKAVRLLRKHNISEVCSLCGYNSLQSFFYNFKKITGKTPKEIKEEKRDK